MNAANAATAEAWHVQRRGPCIEVLDENRLLVASVAGDGRERTVQETAAMIAAAPQLRARLASLWRWLERSGHARDVPRALAEDVGQALQDAGPPL